MNDIQKMLAFAKTVAREAGVVIRDYYDRPEKGTQQKVDKTLVTEADVHINKMVIERLRAQYPTHGIIAEEISDFSGQTDVWVCDPIDGTAPFVFGLPTSMFALAFVHDGEPLIGIAYDPFLDRMFTAVKDQGAWCNDKPIHVVKQAMKGAFVAGPSYVSTLTKTMGLYDRIIAQGAQVPMYPGGIYKGCAIAEGRLHGRIFSGPGTHDVASLKVIIEAAGGRVTDLDGNEQRYDRPIRGAIMSNSTIHDELVAIVGEFGSDNVIKQQR